MRHRTTVVLLTATLATLAGAVPARAALELVELGTYDQPVFATAAPGDSERLFVVEQPGVVKVLRRDGSVGVFLDLKDRVLAGGERGLLSIAFPPDHATTGRFYVYYTGRPPFADGSGDIVVDEYRRDPLDPGRGDPATRRRVLDVPHRVAGNHNGGTVAFGPDGLLYVGTGDGGGGGDPQANGQRVDPAADDADAGRSALLGKLLRVAPTPGDGCGGGCTIPADNPFAGRRDRAPEIWAWGLRNPFRFAFDRASGDLVIGDVGQNAYEEIDHLRRTDGGGRGVNLGWNLYEGRHTYPGGVAAAPVDGFAFPAIEKSHDGDGFCSITGGVVIRDPGLPALSGHYLYGDYCEGRLRAARLDGTSATDDRDAGLPLSQPVGFGEDACGRVIVTSLGGTVARLADGPSDCVLASPYPTAAGPVPGGPGPGPGGSPAAAGSDRTPPVVAVRGTTTQHPVGTGRVSVTIRCDEQCRTVLAGEILAFRASRARGATVPDGLRLKTQRRTLAAGATVRARVRVSLRQRRAIARALRRGRRVSVRITVRATDAAGNTGTGVIRVRVRR